MIRASRLCTTLVVAMALLGMWLIVVMTAPCSHAALVMNVLLGALLGAVLL